MVEVLSDVVCVCLGSIWNAAIVFSVFVSLCFGCTMARNPGEGIVREVGDEGMFVDEAGEPDFKKPKIEESTNLMMANNIVAPAMEKSGCHTFTAPEMAFNLVGLLHPTVLHMVQNTPLHAVLNGKMEAIDDLAGLASRIRARLDVEAAANRLLKQDFDLDAKVEKAGPVAWSGISKQFEKDWAAMVRKKQ